MATRMSADQQIKLPQQLAALIRGEAENLLPLGGSDEAVAAVAEEAAVAVSSSVAVGGGSSSNSNSLSAIVNAAQTRHIKELGSYVRAVCMRMGVSSSDLQ